MKPGWFGCTNARGITRWHKFNDDGMSICGRIMTVSKHSESIPNNAEQCKACRQKVNADSRKAFASTMEKKRFN